MNKETTELLQQLAAKLGTTAEHLWAVLLKQAFVSGCCDLLVYVFTLGLLWLTVKRVPKWLEIAEESDGMEEIAYPIASFVVALMAVIFVIVSIVSIQDTVAAFANPEYWALKQVLCAVRGGS